MGPLSPVGPTWTCTPALGGSQGGRAGGRTSGLRQAPMTPALLSSDPEPASVPRHGPFPVQRGHVLLAKHSRPCQALQVRSPCLPSSAGAAAEAGPADQPVVGGVLSPFPRTGVQGAASPDAPHPHRAAPRRRTGPAC